MTVLILELLTKRKDHVWVLDYTTRATKKKGGSFKKKIASAQSGYSPQNIPGHMPAN